MSPLIAYHATRRACRPGIERFGLLPNQPTLARPHGVYVFRDDDEFNHAAWNSQSEWCCAPTEDLWEVEYIGPIAVDQYTLNGMILLGSVRCVTLVTGNK